MPRPLKARLGHAGYARLLAYIKATPGTLREIAAGFGTGRDTTYRLIPEFHAHGLLHVGAWRCEPGSHTMPVYHYGPGETAAPPTRRPNGRVVTKAVALKPKALSPEVTAFSHVLLQMETPVTLNDIRAETGLHRDTIRPMLDALRAGGLAFIAGYVPRDNCGGQYMATYCLGEKKDASYPARKERRARNLKSCRNYRARQRCPTLAIQRLLTATAANAVQARQAA